MQMCIDSSIQMVKILDCLRTQGLLGVTPVSHHVLKKDTDPLSIETFLPFDLEATFIASVNLLMGASVDQKHVEDASPWLPKAYIVFDEMIASGNLVAKAQKSEVLQLEIMFHRLFVGASSSDGVLPGHVHADCSAFTSAASDALPKQAPQSVPGGVFSPVSDMLGEACFDDIFTSEQILNMANSIDIDDTEWMSQAITDYGLW